MFNKPVIGILLLLVAMMTYVYWPAGDLSAQRRGGSATLVKTDVAKEVILKDNISALGTTQANESVTLTAQSTDRVSDIYFDDGDKVEKGQLLLALEHQEEQALVQELEIKIAEHKRQLLRLQDLKKSSATAQSAIDTQTSLLETTQAQLQVAKIRLQEKFIHAPFTGQLGLRQISPGQLVTNDTKLTSLDDINKIKVEFQLPERYLNRVEQGQKVTATNIAYNTPFIGQVTAISSRVDSVSRAFTARAIFDNQDNKLRPGMLLQVQVETQAAQAMVIPESAIIPMNQNHFVYKVVDNKVAREQVVIGRRAPGVVEVLSGLTLGDEVITQGVVKVRPGSEVKTDNAALSQSTAKVN
ncbi:MAG: efflux RND transporter periplasmic adaptor subunit [Gammaproteobacteria bacterium]|nr:efflux RND transporter periplasmic adaptor subunit [Gammaproteobacteria bacterium]